MRRIHAIGQQGIEDRASTAGQIVHFQALYLLLEISLAGQQGRHGDQGAQVRWYALGQVETGQWLRPDTEDDETTDQQGRKLSGRQQPQQAEQPHPSSAECLRGQ